MIDELLLHIGPTKTGTTTIQMALAESAAEEARAGTFVPLATGGEPGQHLPILREVVGDASYSERYSFSQDRLSLEAVLAAAHDCACTRLLISSEEFSAPTSTEDVFELLQVIRPRRVTVLQAMRSSAPWALSLFAQHITYGLVESSTWPVDRFADWFAEVVLPAPADAVERWREGPWQLTVRTMFVPEEMGSHLTGMFARLAGLQVVLRSGKQANRRLDTCSLHALQALNVARIEPDAPLADRVAVREPVLASLSLRGLPAHDCTCGQVLASEVAEFLAEAGSRTIATWVNGSQALEGDPMGITRNTPAGDLVHCRFPDTESWRLATLLILGAMEQMVVTMKAVTEARDFWHGQAGAWEDIAVAPRA